MKTISILNLKGGVAKTFTAANMAYEIYRRGYRVLLIDNDKQGNLSKAYSRYDAESVAPVTRLLAGDWQGATELIQNTDYVGQQCCIDIVPLFRSFSSLSPFIFALSISVESVLQ